MRYESDSEGGRSYRPSSAEELGALPETRHCGSYYDSSLAIDAHFGVGPDQVASVISASDEEHATATAVEVDEEEGRFDCEVENSLIGGNDHDHSPRAEAEYTNLRDKKAFTGTSANTMDIEM